MPNFGKRLCAPFAASAIATMLPIAALAQTITALPDQTSSIRLSNRDINHLVCQGGEIEDVKFSAEKAIAVEKAGADAWVKFLVKESDDAGQVTRLIRASIRVKGLGGPPGEFDVSTIGIVPGIQKLNQQAPQVPAGAHQGTA